MNVLDLSVTLLRLEQPKLHRVLAILSAIGFMEFCRSECNRVSPLMTSGSLDRLDRLEAPI